MNENKLRKQQESRIYKITLSLNIVRRQLQHKKCYSKWKVIQLTILPDVTTTDIQTCTGTQQLMPLRLHVHYNPKLYSIIILWDVGSLSVRQEAPEHQKMAWLKTETLTGIERRRHRGGDVEGREWRQVLPSQLITEPGEHCKLLHRGLGRLPTKIRFCAFLTSKYGCSWKHFPNTYGHEKLVLHFKSIAVPRQKVVWLWSVCQIGFGASESVFLSSICCLP